MRGYTNRRNNHYYLQLREELHSRNSNPAHILLKLDPLNKTYHLKVAFDIRNIKHVIGGVYVRRKPYDAAQCILEQFRSLYESVTPFTFKGDPIDMLLVMQRCAEEYRV